MDNPNKISHIKIGKCIYCGATDKPLTDEHMVPLSLGGNIILDKASCEICRKMTSKCEKNVISKNWEEVRAITNCKSRKRDWDKELFLLNVVFKDGKSGTLELSKTESPGLTNFPLFPLPGFLDPQGYTLGSRWIGVDIQSFGVNIKELGKKYNLKQISGSVKYENHDFELMIANIAYRKIVADFGLDFLDEIFVLPAIKGEKDDIGYWIGSDKEEKFVKKIGRRQVGSHLIGVGFLENSDKTQKVIFVQIKFFANSDSPEYLIVVGKIKKI